MNTTTKIRKTARSRITALAVINTKDDFVLKKQKMAQIRRAIELLSMDEYLNF